MLRWPIFKADLNLIREIFRKAFLWGTICFTITIVPIFLEAFEEVHEKYTAKPRSNERNYEFDEQR